MGYKVGNLPDINQPVNILEEIVWYKAKEIEAFREKQPLPMLQVRQAQQAHEAATGEAGAAGTQARRAAVGRCSRCPYCN
jgi:hypothetical protein